jgi:hypothetical protein
MAKAQSPNVNNGLGTSQKKARVNIDPDKVDLL